MTSLDSYTIEIIQERCVPLIHLNSLPDYVNLKVHLGQVCLHNLVGLNTLGRFSVMLSRETIVVTSCLLSCNPGPFWKGVYSRRKEFAPKGSKFFPCRVDSFQKGGKSIFDMVTSPESVSIPVKPRQESMVFWAQRTAAPRGLIYFWSRLKHQTKVSGNLHRK